MPVSVALVKKLEEIEPKLRGVLFAILEEIERQREETVTKREFNELKEIVKELAQAQKRTEERLGSLEEAIERLVQAQTRTEERLSKLEEALERLAEAQTRTEERVEALAQAQRRTEEKVSSLEEAVEQLAQAQKRTEARVEELAQAQKRTEERLEELAHAQKRTEERLEELAQAQKRTEEELQKLIREHAKTREQVGGLSSTAGYILENEAMKALPALLREEFGLIVKGKLIRKFVKDRRGRDIEVNIIGEATKNGKKVVIIGEAKVQLSKNNVLEFLRKRIRALEEVFGEIFPILVTHMITQPDVEEYAQRHGIKRIYYSYEF
ncbi:MAG TPA: hypothetical protein ENF51_01770 [Candidatus Aenigmarchaeota archaeon]|nr:hypothetical protein [Candidatus Aenigmarchaeota archaeon]